jgi:hypothetical protein
MTQVLVRSLTIAAAMLLLVATGTPAQASCGDGILDGGEACDAGTDNGTAASCCAADCSFEPASKVCRPAATFCDVDETCTGASDTCPSDAVKAAGTECGLATDCLVANACDGATTVCPPSTKLPDSDGDADPVYNNFCDVTDPCTNVGGARDFHGDQPLLYKARPTSLKVIASFTLPNTTSFADIEPDVRGAIIAEIHVPAGTYAGGGTRGWRQPSPTKWQYLDKTGDPQGGMRKVTISDRSAQQAGLVTVKATGVQGYVTVLPLSVVVTLGTPAVDGAAGRCGETTFTDGNCVSARGRLRCTK